MDSSSLLDERYINKLEEYNKTNSNVTDGQEAIYDILNTTRTIAALLFTN